MRSPLDRLVAAAERAYGVLKVASVGGRSLYDAAVTRELMDGIQAVRALYEPEEDDGEMPHDHRLCLDLERYSDSFDIEAEERISPTIEEDF